MFLPPINYGMMAEAESFVEMVPSFGIDNHSPLLIACFGSGVHLVVQGSKAMGYVLPHHGASWVE